MMAITHSFVGLALAIPVALSVPELGVPAAIGGLIGGFFPDVDMVAEHRKTLHFPVLYWPPAILAGIVAVAIQEPLSVGIALFLLGAAVHSTSDVIGGGLELRPWIPSSNRAVYVHVTGRWLPPLRWVRYDGSPEDLTLAALFALPSIIVFDGVIRDITIAGLAVAIIYTVFRKRIVEWAPDRFH